MGDRLAPPPRDTPTWLRKGTERQEGPGTQPPQLLTTLIARWADGCWQPRRGHCPAAPGTACGRCATSSAQPAHPRVPLPRHSLMPPGSAPSFQPTNARYAARQPVDLGLDYLTAYATAQNQVFGEQRYPPAAKFNL